jgi:hypothetical protein
LLRAALRRRGSHTQPHRIVKTDGRTTLCDIDSVQVGRVAASIRYIRYGSGGSGGAAGARRRARLAATKLLEAEGEVR